MWISQSEWKNFLREYCDLRLRLEKTEQLNRELADRYEKLNEELLHYKAKTKKSWEDYII